jgi:hypothetical protein
MPIGAAIGGAVIGAGGSVIAGSKAAKAQKNAAQTAADTSLTTANANNALYRDIYGQNKALLTPFSNNGLQASNALTELLLGPGSTAGNTTPATGALGGDSSIGGYSGGALDAYLAANPDVAQEGRRVTADGEFPSLEDYAAWHFQHYGQGEGRAAPAVNVPAPTAATGTTGGSALDAFDKFRQGTNYQWRYNQGLNANRSSFATKGALDSGAAIKSAETYGQNIASGELSNYMNLLASQQAMGLSAAGAVAGVGTTYAGNVAAQNTNASNTAANAALTSGQASANMWGTVGNTAGQIGGALFQYGMGGFNQPSFATANSAALGAYSTVPWNVSVANQQPLSYMPRGF